MTGSHPRSRPGFTLVELLVVIAIIVVLASLVFVGGTRAMEKARQAAASSNLRQVGSAVLALTGKESELSSLKRPNAFVSEGGFTRQGKLYTWVHEVAEASGLGSYDSETWGGNFDWSTDPNDSFLHDPTADWDIVDEAKPNVRTEGSIWKTAHFGYNLQLGQWTQANAQPSTRYDPDMSLGDVHDPSSTFLVAQSAGTDGRSKKEKKLDNYVKTDSGQLIFPWRSLGSLANRVNGKGYVMFVDGHIELLDPEEVYAGGWDSNFFRADSRRRFRDSK